MSFFKSLLKQSLDFGGFSLSSNYKLLKFSVSSASFISQTSLRESSRFSFNATRFASTLAPKKRKYRLAQKGRVPVRTGGSQKGNFVAFGDYGIRIKEGVRLSASVLTACQTVIKRNIKVAKGTKMWMRVFPDIPVTAKSKDSRMGKGKGSIEYWACRVPKDKILFEIGGPALHIDVAKETFRLVARCLPVKSVFVDRYNDPHRDEVLRLAKLYPHLPALKVPKLPPKKNS